MTITKKMHICPKYAQHFWTGLFNTPLSITVRVHMKKNIVGGQYFPPHV